MLSRIMLGGLLAAVAVTALANPAEAFGRRNRGSSCSTPVYHEPIYHPIYCPPCIPGPVIPTALDCVKNTTNETLRVYVSSAYGSVSLLIPAGECRYFRFRTNVTTPRVCTAFTLNNTLIATFAFSVIAQNPPYNCQNCLPIAGTAATPTREAPKRDAGGAGAAAPAVDGSLPFVADNDPI